MRAIDRRALDEIDMQDRDFGWTIEMQIRAVELGLRIREVPVPNGATRYDGKTTPHHHFVCEVCGAIQDVEIRMPSGIEERVRRKYRLRPERFRIDFYGLCEDCVDRGSTPSNH